MKARNIIPALALSLPLHAGHAQTRSKGCLVPVRLPDSLTFVYLGDTSTFAVRQVRCGAGGDTLVLANAKTTRLLAVSELPEAHGLGDIMSAPVAWVATPTGWQQAWSARDESGALAAVGGEQIVEDSLMSWRRSDARLTDARDRREEMRQKRGDKAAAADRLSRREARYQSYGWSGLVIEAVIAHRVLIGMSPLMVRESWGEPQHVNRTTTASGTEEQWVYDAGSRYVYLRNDRVTSIQESR